MDDGDSILLWGYDSDNEEWLPILVDSSGQVVVTTE